MPVSFKVRLFKCFLDAAVSEQIARMVAMGGATKNADDLVKSLTRQYNRARQNQITRELADIVGATSAHQIKKGFFQHGHRDDDRTNFPGDRVNVRCRVR